VLADCIVTIITIIIITIIIITIITITQAHVTSPEGMCRQGATITVMVMMMMTCHMSRVTCHLCSFVYNA